MFGCLLVLCQPDGLRGLWAWAHGWERVGTRELEEPKAEKRSPKWLSLQGFRNLTGYGHSPRAVGPTLSPPPHGEQRWEQEGSGKGTWQRSWAQGQGRRHWSRWMVGKGKKWKGKFESRVLQGSGYKGVAGAGGFARRWPGWDTSGWAGERGLGGAGAVGCWDWRILGLWGARAVGCWGCGVFRLWGIGAVGCR